LPGTVSRGPRRSDLGRTSVLGVATGCLLVKSSRGAASHGPRRAFPSGCRHRRRRRLVKETWSKRPRDVFVSLCQRDMVKEGLGGPWATWGFLVTATVTPTQGPVPRKTLLPEGPCQMDLGTSQHDLFKGPAGRQTGPRSQGPRDRGRCGKVQRIPRRGPFDGALFDGADMVLQRGLVIRSEIRSEVRFDTTPLTQAPL
jgi:hypothetical protein